MINETSLGKPRDLGCHCMRPCGDHNLVGRNPVGPVNLERRLIDEPSATEGNVDTEFADRIRALMTAYIVSDPIDTIHNSPEINVLADRLEPELPGVLHYVRRPRRSDQRFRRDAAIMQAVSAKTFAVHE